jgi:tetratricopeptide (TPR) repeat protein
MKLSNILFLACISSTIIACGGAEERKAAYQEKARHSMRIGDLDKARIELKNVLQIDPKDARAYFLLGEIFEKKKDYRKAYVSYSKASELDVNNHEYHAKIGQFQLVFAGDIDKAIEKKDMILNKDPSNVHGLLLKAVILVKQDKIDEAKKIAQDMFSTYPENVDNAIFLTRIYSIEKNFDKAISTLKISMENNKDDESLNNFLARILYSSGRYDEAENELKKSLASHPDLFEKYMTLALFYQKTEKTDEAESMLRRAVNEDREEIRRQLYLVNFIREYRGTSVAIEEVESLIKDSPEIGELRVLLGRLYIAENKLDKAKSIFQSAILDFSDESTGIESRVFMAKIFIEQKNEDKALSIVDEAVLISPNDPAVNLLRARIYLSKNDIESAIISLRIVINNEPENITAYFLLASAYKAIKQNEQANDIINQARENNRSNKEALLALSKYHVKNNEPEQAEKVIDNYLSIDADSYEALTLKINILNSKKEFIAAKPYIEHMLSVHPDKENGYLHAAQQLLIDKKYDDAVELLERGYSKTDNNRKILGALTKIQGSMKNSAAAIKRIEDEIREKGEDAELYMFLASAHIASGNLQESKKHLKRVIQIKPDANQPYILLSKLYLNNGQEDDAMRVLKDGLIQTEHDYAISLSIARLYETNKDYNSAIDTYEVALRKYTDKVVIINNLAALLSEHRSDTSSLKRAKELADKLKDAKQPVILDTAGWVYYKIGNYDDAVSILKSVVEGAPDIPVFNYHLGMAYYKINDTKSAKTFLSKALEGDADFTGRSEAKKLLKTL